MYWRVLIRFSSAPIGSLSSQVDREIDAQRMLSFADFCESMRALYTVCGVSLRKAFDIFDWCQSGTVKRSNLALVLSKLNIVVGPTETEFLRLL